MKPIRLRRGTLDLEAIRACIVEAYSRHIEIIGKGPAAMRIDLLPI